MPMFCLNPICVVGENCLLLAENTPMLASTISNCSCSLSLGRYIYILAEKIKQTHRRKIKLIQLFLNTFLLRFMYCTHYIFS